MCLTDVFIFFFSDLIGIAIILLFVMAFFYILYSILGIECQFINGSGKINVQMIVYIFVAILNVPFSNTGVNVIFSDTTIDLISFICFPF